MWAKLSFLEYEILDRVKFLISKGYKPSLQKILDQLDDERTGEVSAFTRGLMGAKLLSFSKKEGFKLTELGRRYHHSFKMKFDK